MDTNPNDMKSDDFNFDDANSSDTNPNPNPTQKDSSEKNSNLAITIVIVIGILLGAVLLFNERSTGTTSDVTPTAMPTSDRPTSVPVTIPAVLPATVPVTVPPQTNNPMQGIIWQWVSVTDQATSQTTTVSNPQQYTIVFTADGYVNGTADCNSYTGTYSQNNGLTITVTTMTRAACPEGSLEQQYLQLLGNIAAGGPDGSGKLALETAGGAQRMLFQNGGPAQ
jgi:heat shock protein HslJ